MTDTCALTPNEFLSEVSITDIQKLKIAAYCTHLDGVHEYFEDLDSKGVVDPQGFVIQVADGEGSHHHYYTFTKDHLC